MGSLPTREIIGTVLVSLVFVVAAFIYYRIRQRRINQEQSLPRPESAAIGESLFACFYVATVFADSPLERVWAYGLGIRGQAELQHGDDGLSILRQGESSFLIPFSSLISLERGNATIDRGVERDGLVQLRWEFGGQELITSLRVTKHQERNFSQLAEVVRKAK